MKSNEKQHLMPTIVAFETSCDDTAVAVISNRKILWEKAISSLEQHKKFGGVVPEVAARSHEESIGRLFAEAKTNAGKITHVAYTCEPGLPGSLHIGKIFAKSVASILEVPALPINHMMGHIFSFCINKKEKIKFPFIGLVVSGGHTTIYRFDGLDEYRVLNETSDDPIGECLDKIGRVLGLPYPGGISLDKIYDPKRADLKLIKHYKPEDSFSFSGLKTSITNLANSMTMKKQKIDPVQIGSSSLKWTIDELLIKIKYYMAKEKVETLVIGGGVSANKLLRSEIKKIPGKVLLPEKEYSGDNAAMIANYADLLINKK